MTFQQHMDIHRPSSTLSIDRKSSTATYYDDSTGILDDSILDGNIMSPTMSTATMFSPDTPWDDASFTAPFVDRTAAVSTNPFFEQNTNNPYRAVMPQQQQQQQQQQQHQQPQGVWPPSESNSGSRTPLSAKFDFSPDFDSGPSQFSMPMQQPGSSSTPFGPVPVANNVRPSSVFPPAQTEVPAQPMSPHNNKEWMELAAQHMEARPGGPKRMRPNTPPRYSSPFPRRDGIRKKNARFDIPSERNLMNIDHLIAQSKDEDEIKELKQQKRLLRNRQAALDSRQRKKKHTEELEEEKKLWTDQMNRLEEDLTKASLQIEALANEKELWYREAMEAKQARDAIQMEHEEHVRVSTLETGELRKKVSVLTEELKASSSAMSATASSTGFTDFASEMDNLNMGSADWDNYIFVDDEFCGDQATPQAPPAAAAATAATAATQPDNAIVLSHRGKEHSTEVSSEDKPVASGLLLMLLLCGAFVASKSAGGSTPPIPQMPDEVRVASATVLDSIFKDAGVGPSPTSPGQQAHSFIANHVHAMEPSASGKPWSGAATISGADLAAMSSVDIDNFSTRLAPTKDQENEQLFSITPAQYNSLTSADFTRHMYSEDANGDAMSPDSHPSRHRRNLAETLAAMRAESKGDTAAEVYTRSLLWECIPTDVVHEFKRMVEESDRLAKSSGDGGDVKVEL